MPSIPSPFVPTVNFGSSLVSKAPPVMYSDAATIVRELTAFSEEKDFNERMVNYILKTMHPVRERLLKLLDKEVQCQGTSSETGTRRPPPDIEREFLRQMEERRLADEAMLNHWAQQQEIVTSEMKASYDPEFVASVIAFFTRLSELQKLEQTVSIARSISFELTSQLSDLVDEVEMVDSVKAGVSKLMSTVSTRVARKNKLVQSMKGQFADLERELTELDSGMEFIKGMQAEIHSKTQSISQAVNCVVCLEEKRVSELSVNKNCGHIVCTPCANRLSSDSALCPTCREPSSFVKIFV